MVHKTVYLAGPIDGLSYEKGVGWRDDARKELSLYGIKALSPQRGKDYLVEHREIADEMDFAKQEAFFADNPMSNSKAIMARDKFDAVNCSVLFVNFLGATRVSIGTVMEIAWAHIQGKPVVVVIEDEDELHKKHPMLRHTFDFVVNNTTDGLNIVKGILADY